RRGFRARIGLYSAGDRRRRPSERPSRVVPGWATAALARNAFVRRVPLALAGLHAHPAGARRLDRRLGAARLAGGNHALAGGNLISPRRAAGQVRRARTRLADVPRWTGLAALGQRSALGRSSK